jgi:hypothetical protein
MKTRKSRKGGIKIFYSMNSKWHKKYKKLDQHGSDCGPSVFNAMGLMSWGNAVYLASRAKGGIDTRDLLEMVNSAYGGGSEWQDVRTLGEISRVLNNGESLICYIDWGEGGGHFFIIVKHTDGWLYAVDPQSRDAMDLNEYLEQTKRPEYNPRHHLSIMNTTKPARNGENRITKAIMVPILDARPDYYSAGESEARISADMAREREDTREAPAFTMSEETRRGIQDLIDKDIPEEEATAVYLASLDTFNRESTRVAERPARSDARDDRPARPTELHEGDMIRFEGATWKITRINGLMCTIQPEMEGTPTVQSYQTLLDYATVIHSQAPFSEGQIIVTPHGNCWKIISIENGRCLIQKGIEMRNMSSDELSRTSTLIETKLQEIGITDASAIRQIKKNAESMNFEQAVTMFFSRGGSKRYKTRRVR